jgi:hypothetical protein
MEEVFKGFLFAGVLGTLTLKVHKSCSCISLKKAKNPTVYEAVNPRKRES